MDRIVINAVTKRYDNRRALSKITVQFAPKTVCALIGSNGAGKSTLLGILSSLIKPTSGEISYYQDDAKLLSSQVRGQIGFLSHQAAVYGELSAMENLVFFSKLYGNYSLDFLESFFERVGIDKETRHRKTAELSKGMLQRLSLALTLFHNPNLLLLDEPFSGLDPFGVEALQSILSTIHQEQKTALIVTHDFSALDGICNRVLVLKQGRVQFDEYKADGFFAHTTLESLYREACAQ